MSTTTTTTPSSSQSKQGQQQHHHHHNPNRGNNNQCTTCGGKYPHTDLCPAIGHVCNGCGKPNHFQKVCRSQKHKVRQVDDEYQEEEYENASMIQEASGSISVDDTSTLQDDELKEEYVFTLKTNVTKTPRITLHIQDANVQFLIDTGASLNIISQESYNKMTKKPVLFQPCPRVFAYDSKEPLNVLGIFNAVIRHQQKEPVHTKFYVVDTTMAKSENLLSGETTQQLEIIHFALSSVSKPTAQSVAA
jgi:predicted  nucleic acid-binding Zn-ribbon protein